MDPHPPSILVIDADDTIRDLYCILFEEEGYAVTAMSAPDPSSAWIRTNCPSAIVLELMFGSHGPAGLDFLRHLRADREADGVPTVVCTAAVVSQAIENEVAALGAALLPKPFAIDDLLALVGRDTTTETTPC